MKFLYFGDKHNTDNTPENRIDNYQETCLNKDNEIIEIGRKNHIAAFLHPGDFWNEDEIHGKNDYINTIVNRWGLININELISEIKLNPILSPEILEKINNYIPLIGIAGNHDLIGNSLDTLSKTTTGFLSNLGQMNLVTKENPMFFTTEDGLKIAITGTHYHLNTDEPEYIKDYIVEEKLGDIHIHIVHGMLSEKDMGIIKHTKIDDIKHTKADITLCGHNHIGFGVLKYDDKFFVNIGSVTRISNDIKEISRMPKVALIDISKKGIFIEEIPLKTADLGFNVLDRTKKDKKIKKEKELDNFKKEIVNLKDSKKNINIIEFVKDIAKVKSIPEDIKEDVLNRLINKELEESKTKYNKKDSYITKIILENFQSHEYSEFEFKNGFNVLIGESRQGKSAVQRALYWVFENKPSGKNFIKRGKNYCRVTIYLSDNTIVSRYIEDKKSGKNIYEIIYPDGSSESGNTKLMELAQKALGFNYFRIDSKLSLPINFYKQGESWYLIGDKISSPDKARVIGALNGTNLADDVMRDLDSENSKILSSNKEAETRCKNINLQLKDLNNLTNLESIINKNEKLLNQYNELKLKKDKINEILIKYKEININLEKNKLIINKLSKLNNYSQKILNIKNLNFLYQNILKEYKNNIETKNNININESILLKLKKLETLKLDLNNLKNKNVDLVNLSKIFDSYNNKNESLKKTIYITSKLNNINLLNNKLNNIKNIDKTYCKLNLEFNNYNNFNQKISNNIDIIYKLKNLDKFKDSINKYNELIIIKNELIKEHKNFLSIDEKYHKIINEKRQTEAKLNIQKIEYKKLLKELNICPICKKVLNENDINEIIEKGNKTC